MHDVKIGSVTASNDRPLTVIAGPCQLESLDHARMIATEMARVCDAYGAQFVFKGSYDKANRTSLSGERGLGMDEGLAIHAAIKAEFGCPVLTDVHAPDQCTPVAEVCDILQIPAFLCRGNKRLLLTERGVSFGYNALVADMRSLPEMMKTGYPVVMDATHAVAQPGGLGGSSGGQREFAPVLARAAVAQGIAAVFLETHQDPDAAPSDGPNMIQLSDMDAVLRTLMALDGVAKADPIRL